MADPNGFNFKNFSLGFLVINSRPHRKPEVTIFHNSKSLDPKAYFYT